MFFLRSRTPRRREVPVVLAGGVPCLEDVPGALAEGVPCLEDVPGAREGVPCLEDVPGAREGPRLDLEVPVPPPDDVGPCLEGVL